MNILLLNAGSSSLKATLVNADDGATIARGLADWAGTVTRYEITLPDGKQVAGDASWKGHAPAVRYFLAELGPHDQTTLQAVGHRIVHGGPFTSSVRITPEVRARIAGLVDLAPLHNPPSLEALGAAEAALPSVPHIAVFDTAFHATLAPEAYTYPVPARWTRDWGIRRYGFHGLSHAYCATRAAELLPAVPDPRLVICHLGHGCSASAVVGGRSVDTTMGFTPLDGLMMATRSGSIDPGILLHVQQHYHLTPAQIEAALNRESGLLGVSGVSADMRDVLAALESDHVQARLAIDIYTRRVRQAIGALTVTMGGVDALVFTAGVGENSAEIRASICAGLDCLGLEIGVRANFSCKPDADIATANSRGRIFVIATREDVTMLKEVIHAISGQ